MKLERLYSLESDAQIFRKYLCKFKELYESTVKSGRLLNEAKITITIDDEEKKPEIQLPLPSPEPQVIHHNYGGIPQEAKEKFIQAAQEIGNFGNPDWVNKLTNGLKQVGVQGLQPIKEEERPVTNKEIMQLISALVELVGK